jgi:hypothetical protein
MGQLKVRCAGVYQDTVDGQTTGLEKLDRFGFFAIRRNPKLRSLKLRSQQPKGSYPCHAEISSLSSMTTPQC